MRLLPLLALFFFSFSFVSSFESQPEGYNPNFDINVQSTWPFQWKNPDGSRREPLATEIAYMKPQIWEHYLSDVHRAEVLGRMAPGSEAKLPRTAPEANQNQPTNNQSTQPVTAPPATPTNSQPQSQPAQSQSQSQPQSSATRTGGSRCRRRCRATATTSSSIDADRSVESAPVQKSPKRSTRSRLAVLVDVRV